MTCITFEVNINVYDYQIQRRHKCACVPRHVFKGTLVHTCSIITLDAVENIDAHTVHGYVIHDVSTSSSVTLGYPLDEKNVTKTGRSFHHGRFVMGLRNLAIKYGCVIIVKA